MIERSLLWAKRVFQLAKLFLVSDWLDENEKDFIVHNEKIWGHPHNTKEDGEILLESSSMSSSIIAFSYLANLLAKLHRARIVAYSASSKNIITQWTNRKVDRIYRSFNVTEFTYHELTPPQLDDVKRLFNEIISSLKTKRDVEDLKIEGTWMGDLLYDSHCMTYKVPTIVLNDPRFHETIKNALSSYVFWRDYLNTHHVRSIIVTHTVYVQSGALTRLAIARNIPVYQISATHLHYITNKNLWDYGEFLYYPEQFCELPEDEKRRGLQLAKERLQKRFSGEVGVDMYYSTKSAYAKPRRERVIAESHRTKILIATHCFFDNPHPYGINLFPDFYEWLDFLGEISKKTDYDWYIKTHPDFLPGNIPILEGFIKKYPKFNLIPSDTSHLQLIEEGINYGLTVYGTIGFEYAMLGIPVINASLCNPHIRYKFNIHPRTIAEYEKILMDLPNQKLEIDINEVYEYYFMAFIYTNTNNWLFQDYEDFVKEVGGYTNQFGPISYKVFLREFTLQKHEDIKRSLGKFIFSKEYRFRDKGVVL